MFRQLDTCNVCLWKQTLFAAPEAGFVPELQKVSFFQICFSTFELLFVDQGTVATHVCNFRDELSTRLALVGHKLWPIQSIWSSAIPFTRRNGVA